MIIPGSASTLILDNRGEGQTFSAKVSAKAFYMVAAQLYQHKERAIIRELSCNALDSHLMAKNPDKFQVFLPNALNPWFKVRDFGTGISEKDMYDVFCVLFESTKEQSNEVIGALGLGCKSPFSYTDAFQVVSYQNSQKTVYSIYYDQEKLPTCMKVLEAETDEPNGLEISFAVDPKDFSKFRDEAQYVFTTFFNDTRPQIFGQTLTFPETHTLTENIYLIDSNLHNERVYIVQGGIAYPLPHNYYTDSNFECFKGKIFINVPIGSVRFTPNREHLEEVQSNKDFIATLQTDFSVFLEDKVKEVVDLVETELDAKYLYHASNFDHPAQDLYYSLFTSSMQYFQPFKDKLFAKFPNAIGRNYTFNFAPEDLPKIKLAYPKRPNYYYLADFNVYDTTPSQIGTVTTNCKRVHAKDWVLIVQDAGKYERYRTSEIKKKHEDKLVFVIKDKDKDADPVVYQTVIDEFSALNVPIVYTSSVAEPVKTPKAQKAIVDRERLSWFSNFYDKTYTPSPEMLKPLAKCVQDPSKPFYYIPYLRSDFIYTEGSKTYKISRRRVLEIIKAKLGDNVPVVVCQRAKVEDIKTKFKGQANCLISTLIDILRPDLDKVKHLKSSSPYIDYSHRYLFEKLKKHRQDLPELPFIDEIADVTYEIKSEAFFEQYKDEAEVFGYYGDKRQTEIYNYYKEHLALVVNSCRSEWTQGIIDNVHTLLKELKK